MHLLLQSAVDEGERTCGGALVPQDEVSLAHPALVGAKHDGVGRRVHQLRRLEFRIVGQELEVGAAAGDVVGELHLVLEGHALRHVDRLCQLGGQPVELALVLRLRAQRRSALSWHVISASTNAWAAIV